MKVVITGHTSGIGKAIYDKLIELGHEVWGLSRSNAYDLSTNSLGKFVKAIENNDVFINNAYYEYAQVDLLYRVYEKWKDEYKMIINIGSVTGDSSKKWPHKYQVHKVALDNASKQLRRVGNCKICNIRPGWVDTPLIKHLKDTDAIDKDLTILKPEQIAEAVVYIMKQPKEVCLDSISIEPWWNNYK